MSITAAVRNLLNYLIFLKCFFFPFKFNESNHHIKTTWEYCPEMNANIVNDFLTSGYFSITQFLLSVENHCVYFFAFLLKIFVLFGHSSMFLLIVPFKGAPITLLLLL